MGTDQLVGQPQIQIVIDRAAIGRYGLAVSDIQTVVATAIGGQAATQVLEGERSFDLVVRVNPKSVADCRPKSRKVKRHRSVIANPLNSMRERLVFSPPNVSRGRGAFAHLSHVQLWER